MVPVSSFNVIKKLLSCFSSRLFSCFLIISSQFIMASGSLFLILSLVKNSPVLTTISFSRCTFSLQLNLVPLFEPVQLCRKVTDMFQRFLPSFYLPAVTGLPAHFNCVRLRFLWKICNCFYSCNSFHLLEHSLSGLFHTLTMKLLSHHMVVTSCAYFFGAWPLFTASISFNFVVWLPGLDPTVCANFLRFVF